MKNLNRFCAVAAVSFALALLTGCPPKPPSPHLPGTTIVVPPQSAQGVPYTILPGDTIYSVAKKFNVEWGTIMDANPSLDPRAMPVGTIIIIPNGQQTTVPPPPPTPYVGGEPAETPGERSPISAEARFVWPVQGQVFSRFHQPMNWRMGELNNGIDIRAGAGTPVVAAKSGLVSTFTNVAGFGKVVTIQHQDNTLTFYGHLDKIKCAHGTYVRQGSVIGTVGTGQSSGAELAFRLYQGDRLVDPLPLLR